MTIIYDRKLRSIPLIGILTSRKKDGTVAGNGPLFINLQKKLISLDGISFVFTLEGVREDSIEGFIFLPEKNSWERIRTPFPDLVYNRIPFRKHEQNDEYQKFFTILKEKNIPFFNPCFIDKYELYQLLKDHSLLKQHLPKSIQVNEKKLLQAFIDTHQSIYLKPSQSSKGKGIFKVGIDEQQRVLFEGLTEQNLYLCFNQFWEQWGKVFTSKHYLAQEEIKSSLWNGKRFDFRILAHAQNDQYNITGIGIRQSQEQDITTHIPKGGKLLPYALIQSNEHDRFIKMAVEQIGKSLSQHLGFFGEFSIDAAVSQTGNYYIFEVNSKPMSFDEHEIEENKINQLCRLFLELTGFKK